MKRQLRGRRLGMAGTLLVGGALWSCFAAGCGGDDDPGGTPNPGGKDATADQTNPPTPDGSTPDGSTPTPGNGTIGTITEAAKAGAEFNSPFDAALDPAGANIYFTAIDPNGEFGVFKVASTGGAVTKLFSGAPLTAAFGIAINDTGTQLYIADPGADAAATEGKIFVLPVAGGTPTALTGTDGFSALGLDTVGSDIYFTGSGPDGIPGVYKVPSAGGTPTAVAKGPPFVDPSGVAVTKAGVVFVLDSSASGTQRGKIIKVVTGTATLFTAEVQAGYPAGIALAQDESAVLVSALDPVTGTNTAIRVSLTDQSETKFNKSVETFTEPGGLHRAKNADVYAWVDGQAAGGTVFVLKK